MQQAFDSFPDTQLTFSAAVRIFFYKNWNSHWYL